MADVAHPVRVVEQRQAAGQHLVGIGEPAAAVDVERECRVAQFGQRVGPCALKVVEAGALGPDQDCGPRAGACGEREASDHGEAVCRVLDGARRDGLHENPP
nr:hypothetical protein [Amycolatopsis sp. M39]